MTTDEVIREVADDLWDDDGEVAVMTESIPPVASPWRDDPYLSIAAEGRRAGLRSDQYVNPYPKGSRAYFEFGGAYHLARRTK